MSYLVVRGVCMKNLMFGFILSIAFCGVLPAMAEQPKCNQEALAIAKSVFLAENSELSEKDVVTEDMEGVGLMLPVSSPKQFEEINKKLDAGILYFAYVRSSDGQTAKLYSVAFKKYQTACRLDEVKVHQ